MFSGAHLALAILLTCLFVGLDQYNPTDLNNR